MTRFAGPGAAFSDRRGAVAAHSLLGRASVVVGIATLLAEAANVSAGLLQMASHMTAAILILAATLPAAAGLALALASLIRREPQRSLGHYGLWLNGWIAILAAPLALAWMLAR